MKFEMHKNSLFAVLLRSPFWISFAIAGGLFLVARMFLPEEYAIFTAVPFVGVGLFAAWKQFRAPSAARVATSVDALREMSWSELADAVEAAYSRDGYTVKRLSGADADFELVKAGRTTLLAAKRWKAARTGAEPLRDLHQARRRREAYDCAYLVAGEVTDNARKFAIDHNIRLVQGAELVRLVPAKRRGA